MVAKAETRDSFRINMLTSSFRSRLCRSFDMEILVNRSQRNEVPPQYIVQSQPTPVKYPMIASRIDITPSFPRRRPSQS